MEKILISVYVMTIDEEYDLFVPINEKVGNIVTLVQQSIKDFSGDVYQINPNALLYNSLDGKVINNNNIVKFSGLTNGARLLLV